MIKNKSEYTCDSCGKIETIDQHEDEMLILVPDGWKTLTEIHLKKDPIGIRNCRPEYDQKFKHTCGYNCTLHLIQKTLLNSNIEHISVTFPLEEERK